MQTVGNSQCGLSKLLFISGVPMAIIGVGLVVVGILIGGGASGACFVWPLPLIISCGLGSGTSFDLGEIVLIAVLGFAVLFSVSLFSVLRGRKRR